MSSRLLNHHYQAGAAILLYQDVIEFLIAFLACQYAGITAIPVFFSTASKQRARLDAILKDSGAQMVFSTRSAANSKLQAEFFSGAVNWLFTDEQEPQELVALPIVDNSRPAFVQYTSGSTGNPKGIVITGANLMANEAAIQKTFGCNEQSVIFSWLPFFHDMGLIGNLLHTLYAGCTCVLMSPLQFVQEPRKWLAGISKYRATHSGGPNFAYDLCNSRIKPEQVAELDLSCWKVAYNGSEPVKAATIEAFSEKFKFIGFQKNAFVPCYGLAEATLLVSGVKTDTVPRIIQIDTAENGRVQLANSAAPSVRSMVSAGRIAHGMNVKIWPVAEALTEGEICIAGDSVTSGYWNRQNDELFVEIDGKKYLRTGDRGFFYADELYISGRIREMIVVRGKNIYPYDIEQAVCSVEGVNMNGAVVFSRLQKEDELVVVAELTRATLETRQHQLIIQQISNQVIAAAGLAPYDVVLTGPLAIPRTTSGKLQRVQCRQRYEQQGFTVVASRRQLQVGNHQRNPLLKEAVLLTGEAEDIERYLSDLIRSKVPQFDQAQLDASAELTEIGLDSIKAMEMINLINRELDITIDIYRVFSGNSVGHLVDLIANTLWIKNNQLSGKEIII